MVRFAVVWCAHLMATGRCLNRVPTRASDKKSGAIDTELRRNFSKAWRGLRHDFQHPRPDFRTYTRPRTPNTGPGHQIHVQIINLYTQNFPKSTKIPKHTHKHHRFQKILMISPAKFRCDSNGNNQISPKPVKIKNVKNRKIVKNRQKWYDKTLYIHVFM